MDSPYTAHPYRDERDWRGKLAHSEVTWTGPWSLQARLPGTTEQPSAGDVIPVRVG